MKTFLLSLLLVISLLISFAQADERILSFHSDITVYQDSTMTVKETIKVRAEGVNIKRGIYRDFPTKYKDSRNNLYHVGFRIVSVTRNDSPEPYHITGLSNGKRVYIGDEKIFLSPGEYVYAITYTTDHQLGFFEGFDELYWNVTGNGWDFPIDKASAEIHLPAEAGRMIISSAGYTGPQGAKGTDFVEQRLPSGLITFSTIRPLGFREGLTVAVSWPKGYVVKPPTRSAAPKEGEEPIGAGSSYGLLGLFILLGYYLLVWSRVGRDPEAGIIVVRYAPPSDMSPAVMRFITRMGYDEKGFAAALIDCAVKGHIVLYEEDGEYRIKKKDDGRIVLSTEEKKVLDHLFGADREMKLIQRNHTYIRKAIKELTSYLQQKYEKIYFITNRKSFIIGLLLTGILLFVSGFIPAYSKGTLPTFLFFCVWLTIWSAGVVMLVRTVYLAWKGVVQGRQKALKGAGAVFITLFSLPFIGGEIMGMTMLAKFSSVMVVVFLIASMAINYLFFHLLKAPTRAGRNVLDAIE
ncbi:MAG: DUF2207 domain-containing protein, partial [Nitrospirota bacterium]|nr:DUF2207 domain-containing protein [Nitrospirota bacterium]